MPSSIENIDNLSSEELLGPPKYDGIGVLMAFLLASIVGVIVGIIIILAAYLVIGSFTLHSGASPILLAFISFGALTIGNLLYTFILGKIFPHIYGRQRTSLAQIVIASIILYIFFIPVYLLVSSISPDMKTILYAFSAHVIINVFTLIITLGLISRYRYALLMFYASIVSLLVTTMMVVLLQVRFSDSENALFILLGLPILAYVIATTLTITLAFLYHKMYMSTGSDPIGSVFARIEEEEKMLEQQVTKNLTQFKS